MLLGMPSRSPTSASGRPARWSTSSSRISRVRSVADCFILPKTGIGFQLCAHAPPCQSAPPRPAPMATREGMREGSPSRAHPVPLPCGSRGRRSALLQPGRPRDRQESLWANGQRDGSGETSGWGQALRSAWSGSGPDPAALHPGSLHGQSRNQRPAPDPMPRRRLGSRLPPTGRPQMSGLAPLSWSPTVRSARSLAQRAPAGDAPQTSERPRGAATRGERPSPLTAHGVARHGVGDVARRMP